MGKPFTVNINRLDPYKSYRFLVYFDTSTTPVAGMSKVTALTSPARQKIRSPGCAIQRKFGLQSSVYLSDRPRDFSTGYFFALAAILASMALARSMPQMLANSSA